MPKIHEHREAKIRRLIRDTFAVDPLITMQGLSEVLERKLNRPVDRHYLSRTIKKVHGEIMSEVDRDTAIERVARVRENYRLLTEELRRMAYAEGTGITEKRKCIDSIARMDNMLAKLEMDFGIFTRNLGEVDIKHHLVPIDDVHRSNIIRAFGAWFIAPQMRKIEPTAMIPAQTTTIPNDREPTQPSAIQRIPTTTGMGLVDAE